MVEVMTSRRPAHMGSPLSAGGGRLRFNPLRMWRRRRRLREEAAEEARFLRLRHGDNAVTAAQEKLVRPDITSWGRAVLTEAIRLLRS